MPLTGLFIGRSRWRSPRCCSACSPAIEVYELSLASTLGSRPEFQRLALEKEKLVVERRLAAKQTLPGIDGQLLGNQDAGCGKSSLSGDILEITAWQKFWRAESDLRAADASLGPESPGLLRGGVMPVIPQAQ